MNCSRIQDQIDDHVDGLLSAPDGERVRAHLNECQDCREEAEAARLASTSLAAWGDEFGELDPPEHCFESILGRIDALPPEALERAALAHPRFTFLRGGRMPATWLAASAAAVAAVLVVALQLTVGPSPRNPERNTRHPAVAHEAPASASATRNAVSKSVASTPVPKTVSPQSIAANTIPAMTGADFSAAALSASGLFAAPAAAALRTQPLRTQPVSNALTPLGVDGWVEDQGLRRRRVILPQSGFPVGLPGSPIPAKYDASGLYPR